MITNRKGNVKTIYQLNAEDKCLTIKTMFCLDKINFKSRLFDINDVTK